MGHIFISHAEEDARVATELARLLGEAGYSTWHYEQDSKLGLSYLAQIAQAVEEAGAFVLVISRSAFRSPHVDREVTRAIDYRKPIIPLLYRIRHEEFQREKPDWSFAIGAAVSLQLPKNNVTAVVPEVVDCLKKLGVGAAEGTGPHGPSPPRGLLPRLRPRVRIAAAALCSLAALALLLWLFVPSSSKLKIDRLEGSGLVASYDGKDDFVYVVHVEVTNYGPDKVPFADIRARVETLRQSDSEPSYQFDADDVDCFSEEKEEKGDDNAKPLSDYVAAPLKATKMRCRIKIGLPHESDAAQKKAALLHAEQRLTVAFIGKEVQGKEEVVGEVKLCFLPGDDWTKPQPFNHPICSRR
jgi:hypothetical protein